MIVRTQNRQSHRTTLHTEHVLGSQLHFRTQVPRDIHSVFARPLSHVPYQKEGGRGYRLQRKHPTSMHNWRFKAFVTVVAPHKEIEAFPRNPPLNFRVRKLLPAKRACRIGLILAVDAKRVVHCGTGGGHSTPGRHIQMYPDQ